MYSRAFAQVNRQEDKKMKRILIWTLVLATVFGLCACAEAADVTGDWYLSEILIGETSYPASAVGTEVAMTVNADGTVRLVSGQMGEQSVDEGTWTFDGEVLTVLSGEGEEQVNMPFALADGKLMCEMGDGVSVFTREKPETREIPALVSAADESEFFGAWALESVSVGGYLAPADSFGLETELIVDAGQVTMIMSGSEILAPTTFSDGVLSFGEEAVTCLQLTDGEYLAMYSPAEDGAEGGVIMYLVRQG